MGVFDDIYTFCIYSICAAIIFVILIILVGALNTLTESLNKSAKRRKKNLRRSTSFNRLAKKITKKEQPQNLNEVALSPVPHISEPGSKSESEDNLAFLAPTITSTVQFENSSDEDDDYEYVADTAAAVRPAALVSTSQSKALIVRPCPQLAVMFT